MALPVRAWPEASYRTTKGVALCSQMGEEISCLGPLRISVSSRARMDSEEVSSCGKLRS